MRLFLFGTLRWPPLLAAVAGRPVSASPARLPGRVARRASDGDWPVLAEGGGAEGVVTEALDGAALARLDWYERAYGCVREAASLEDGTRAVLYGCGGAPSGEAWDLDAWVARLGPATLATVPEVMRAAAGTAAALAPRLGVIRARGWNETLAAAPRDPMGARFAASDVAVRGVRHPFDGFHRVEVWTVDHPRHDGGREEGVERAISVVTDAATVLPWDRARNRVAVVEQLRVGALAKGDPDPWLIEPPAGLIDFGEDPEATALRELREETGLAVERAALRLVTRAYPSPGGLSQVIWCYVAECDLPDGAEGTGGLAEEAEDLRVRLFDVDALRAAMPGGGAGNMPLGLSLQWIALERAGLNPG